MGKHIVWIELNRLTKCQMPRVSLSLGSYGIYFWPFIYFGDTKNRPRVHIHAPTFLLIFLPPCDWLSLFSAAGRITRSTRFIPSRGIQCVMWCSGACLTHSRKNTRVFPVIPMDQMALSQYLFIPGRSGLGRCLTIIQWIQEHKINTHANEQGSWLSQKTTTPPFSIHFSASFLTNGWNPHENGIKSSLKYICEKKLHKVQGQGSGSKYLFFQVF